MKWTFNNTNRMLLKALCESYAPSSEEVRTQKIIANYFENKGVECWGDAMGNLYASTNSKCNFHIGIVAHSDEIAMQITDIDNNGLLRFRKVGGLRATSLIGHRVVVLGNNGIVEGIIGCDPLQDNGTDAGILVRTADLWIDLGGESKEESESMVSIGDFALFKSDFYYLGRNRIVSKSLDNRLGSFIMSEVVSHLLKSSLAVDVVAVSTVQEEINMGGIASCRTPLDVAIVVDVDFATDIPTAHTNMGNLFLGRGIGINYNADSNSVLQQYFCKIAKEHNIPIQATLSRNVSGGTDATIARTLGNVATLNINIPIRYMHSHYEMCDVRDVEHAINSIIHLIEYLNDNDIRNFIPWQQ